MQGWWWWWVTIKLYGSLITTYSMESAVLGHGDIQNMQGGGPQHQDRDTLMELAADLHRRAPETAAGAG